MKKISKLSVLLVCILCLLCGCASKQEQSTASTAASTSSTAPSEPQVNTITIAQALELCGEEGNITEERYYIRAIVQTITDANYGSMIIEDDTGSISVYGTYSEDGSVPYDQLQKQPHKGDEVLLHCILQNYKGTKEIKNARLISFTENAIQVDESLYAEMTIDQARQLEAGSYAKVTGVVAQITYANGMIPAGVYLVDSTNSIFIHDRDLAQRVQIGNEITILGTKAYWILEAEQKYAQKYGYTGSCQLEDVVLVSNDERTDKGFDHSWIPESTIKQILDTPVSQNITTTIFKVNALIRRVDGKGFINYYFFDLDNETSAYAYTQCNGDDFAWLDEFDGKICTVYLSAINAKSTEAACYFRLQPIQVIDEGFAFDDSKTSQHVLDYYGVGQFQSSYSGDPKLPLITEVSSDMLGFAGATLSYATSDPSVVYFQEEAGVLYMHTGAAGTATITVTGSYDGSNASKTVTITVSAQQTVAASTVKEAINAEDGQALTVLGIVGPSLVNQSGFYLIDSTGLIAVSMDAQQMQSLQIGHEVVVQGIRDTDNPKSSACHGQSRLKDAVVVTNHYGAHDYDTSHFVTGKTIADFNALALTEDYTTTAFIITGTVTFEETAYYTTVKFTDGSKYIQLYCSNASQYEFLKAFDGQQVTVEIAACNWNSKTNYYAGCILAVLTENGKVMNTLNFS